ncbi:helix-hairpin-helix domain-containing protein, partial [Methanosphaera sp.]
NQNNKHNPADDFNNINNENIRPNEVNRKNKNIKKIDINTAGIDDIKKLPGITIISAKKLIQYRENGNYVKSMYDLGEKLNLKDYQLEQLRPYVLISKNKEYTTTNYTRRVDL